MNDYLEKIYGCLISYGKSPALESGKDRKWK